MKNTSEGGILSQHHVQKHHDGKARDDAHSGKIGLRFLLALAFGDELVNSHKDHSTPAKARAKGNMASI